MASKRFRIGPFGELVKSIDARYIGETQVNERVNIRDAEGGVAARYGFKLLSVPGTKGIHFQIARGYDDNLNPVVEYLLVDEVGANHEVKSLSCADGSVLATLATISSTNRQWFGASYRHLAVLTDRQDVYFHEIGDNSSWQSLDTGSPPTKPTFVRTYPADGSTYTREDWMGLVDGDQAYTGACGDPAGFLAAGSVLSPIQIGISNSTTGESSFEIDFTLRTSGIPEFRDADFFAFTLVRSTGYTVDWNSVSFQFTNVGGTKTFTPEEKVVKVDPSDTRANVWVRFAKDDRDDWNLAGTPLIQKMKITFDVVTNGGAGTDYIQLFPMWKGGIDYMTGYSRFLGDDDDDPGTQDVVYVAVTYYNSTADVETPFSEPMKLRISDLMGKSTIAGLPAMGKILTFNGGSSATGSIDKERWYIRKPPDGEWFGIQEQDDAVGDWYWEPTSSLPPSFERSNYTFDNENVVSMFSYRGSMCWLYRGGENNVRYTQIGFPFRQFSEEQDPTLDFLGENFPLSENLADEPIEGYDIGRSVVIIGNNGVYSHSGDKPRLMTPLKPIPNAPGGFGPFASCVWKPQGGNFGVAYLAKDGDSIWFAEAGIGFDGEVDYQLIELSKPIRGHVKEWLLGTTPGATWGRVVMFTDRAGDLFVFHKTRALAFRKTIGENSTWECYEYALTSSLVGASTDAEFGTRIAQESGGRIDSFEAAYPDFLKVDGSGRDGGMPIPSARITTRINFGANSRIGRIYRDAANLLDRVVMTLKSTRRTSTLEFASGKRVARAGPLQQGHEHQITVAIEESASTLYGLDVDIITHGGERPNE